MFGRLHVEPAVLGFLKAYPDISVRLVLADNVIDLVDTNVDVALRIGELPDSSLVATRLGAVGWVTCASPAYLAARGTPETPDELGEHDCIMFKGLSSNTAWNFGRGKSAMALPVRPRLAVNTADGAIMAAIAGAGVTRVLSYQIAAALAAGALQRVLRPFEPEALPVHLVHAGQALLPLKVRAFLDFAAPRLKASLAEIAG